MCNSVGMMSSATNDGPPTDLHKPNTRTHLIRFLFKHRNFWIPELTSLLQLSGQPTNPISTFFDINPLRAIRSPFLPATFPNDEVARQVCSKAVLINRVYEVWASALSYSDLAHAIEALPNNVTQEYYAENVTWSVNVDAFGVKLTSHEQNERRGRLTSALKFRGKVNLKHPDHVFWIIEDWGDQAMVSYKERQPLTSTSTSTSASSSTTSSSSTSSSSSSFPTTAATSTTSSSTTSSTSNIFSPQMLQRPKKIYFLREICQGDGGRVAKTYSLKQRKYLGPTSMDVQLSFVMAHQGLVRPGSIVMDPFVGTGSLLIACAAMGASLTIGTDIDVRVLKGMNRIARTTDSNIFTNFQQYNLPPPCILRADNSRRGNVFRNASHWSGGSSSGSGGSSSSSSSSSSSGSIALQQPFLDAIVCDPPYGVRAGAKKCGTLKKSSPVIPEQYNDDHVTMTQKYETEDVMLDLLDAAASMLVMGGRLVYLLPCLVDFDSDEELPTHPCLQCVANSEQTLSQYWSRRLITMEKVHEYDTEQTEKYLKVARDRIRHAQTRHLQTSVAYTDLQNKIKQMSHNNKKISVESVLLEETTNETTNETTATGKKRKSNVIKDGTEITLRKRSKKLFVTPREIAVKAGGERAHAWSYYGYQWRASLVTEENVAATTVKWGSTEQMTTDCDVLFNSGTVSVVPHSNGTDRLCLKTMRGSMWGSCAQSAYNALLPELASSTSSSSSFLPHDVIVSKRTIQQHLVSAKGGSTFENGFGIQVSIKFSPYGSRDEAGLYLWLDPLNYIKIIVEGARRHTSKPEVTIGTQQSGLPTSSPTYWSAKGLSNVNEFEYTLRLEMDARKERCAGMVWCELEKTWHVVGVLSLLSSSNLRSWSQLRPMVCTFTPKLHPPEDHQGQELSAEFSRFQIYEVQHGGNITEQSIESRKLKLK